MIVLLLVTLPTDPYRLLKKRQNIFFYISFLLFTNFQSNTVALEGSCQSMVYRSVTRSIIHMTYTF